MQEPVVAYMAERAGFEPAWDFRPQPISSRCRYDHFEYLSVRDALAKSHVCLCVLKTTWTSFFRPSLENPAEVLSFKRTDITQPFIAILQQCIQRCGKQFLQ